MSVRIISGNIAIGGTVGGGTSGSVLFVNPNGIIAQENADFNYNASTNSLTVTGTDGADPSFAPISGMGMYNVGSGTLGFSTGSTFSMGIDSSGRLGIGTTNPTHSITLPSTSSGMAFYNTSDQTTNYERVVGNWSGNEYRISTGKGGSGTTRALRLTAGGAGGLGEVLLGYGSGQNVYILTNNTTRLYISNSATQGTVAYFPITGDATFTAAGTTGNQTINKPEGSVNFAAGASSITVTNNMVTANSVIQCTIMTNDATAQLKNVVPASGSFVINLSAAATAETKVGFFLH